MEIVNLGADLHDKMAAVIVEAWETIFRDGLWHFRFKSKDMAKKSLESNKDNGLLLSAYEQARTDGFGAKGAAKGAAKLTT